MALKRFGVSLEDDLLDQLDRYVQENGYANRSQAIRFLIEKNLAERKWQCNHIVAGTVVLLFDQAKREIPAKITLIQQEFTSTAQQDLLMDSAMVSEQKLE